GRDRGRARRLVAAGAAVAALLAGGVLTVRAWAPVEAPPACDAGAALAAEVWNDAARARVRAAFAATEGFQRVDAALGERLARWSRAHRDACLATHVRHEQSEALLDRRMRCLGRARAEIAALVGALQTASGVGLDRAAGAAAQAGDVRSCSDS